MILCVGLIADDTFVHTIAALKMRGIPFDVVDIAQLALSGSVYIEKNDLLSATIRVQTRRLRLSSYQSAFVRMLEISDHAPTERLRFRSQGLHRALSLLFHASPIPILNPPLRNNSNFTKVLHSTEIARITGWPLPRTLLSNVECDVREFIASCPGGVIFKGTSSAKTWVTLYDENSHASTLGHIAECPVLFQERIDGPDVRVHTVGKRIFAELIEADGVDYRTLRGNRYSKIVLPEAIASGCAILTESLGIPLLGIDFKVDRLSGQWFCLEANSLPCYQGYDRRCGGEIASALVEWLTSNQ